ncbi:MAG: DUF4328 domain-containing protein [Verrucomicrobiota bacterium JB024]|nr:DUF4328 domain-containing protein [Verrucomicrobiota bacterium JB024]
MSESAAIPPHLSTGYTYQVDPTSLTRLLITLLWVNVGAASVLLLSDFLEYSLLLAADDLDAVGLAWIVQTVLGLIWTVYSVFLGVVFLRWIYRANKNCHGFGAEGMAFSPGWSIGYYFIPLLNLYQPFRAMKEIMQVSQCPGDWKRQPTGGLIYVWWTLWLLSLYLTALAFKVPVETHEDYIRFPLVFILSDCETIILGIMAILLVKRIARAQERLVQDKNRGY